MIALRANVFSWRKYKGAFTQNLLKEGCRIFFQNNQHSVKNGLDYSNNCSGNLLTLKTINAAIQNVQMISPGFNTFHLLLNEMWWWSWRSQIQMGKHCFNKPFAAVEEAHKGKVIATSKACGLNQLRRLPSKTYSSLNALEPRTHCWSLQENMILDFHAGSQCRRASQTLSPAR